LTVNQHGANFTYVQDAYQHPSAFWYLTIRGIRCTFAEYLWVLVQVEKE